MKSLQGQLILSAWSKGGPQPLSQELFSALDKRLVFYLELHDFIIDIKDMFRLWMVGYCSTFKFQNWQILISDESIKILKKQMTKFDKNRLFGVFILKLYCWTYKIIEDTKSDEQTEINLVDNSQISEESYPLISPAIDEMTGSLSEGLHQVLSLFSSKKLRKKIKSFDFGEINLHCANLIKSELDQKFMNIKLWYNVNGQKTSLRWGRRSHS